MVYGNKPTDGGFLFLDPEEYQAAIAKEPGLTKYIRRMYGATEYIIKNGSGQTEKSLTGVNFLSGEKMTLTAHFLKSEHLSRAKFEVLDPKMVQKSGGHKKQVKK